MRVEAERFVRIVLWLAGAACFVFVLHSAAPQTALPIIASLGAIALLALLPYIAQIALDALAWRALLVGVGHRVHWRRLIAVRLISEAVLMSVPGGSFVGESLKPYLLARTTRVPVADTLASLGLKRSLLGFAQALYLALAVIVGHHALSRVVDELPLIIAIAAAVLGVVAVGLGLAFVHGRIADRVFRVLGKLPSRRLRAALDRRRAGFAATDHAFGRLGERRGLLAGSLALLFGAWLVEAFETWLICHLLGIGVSPIEALVMEAAVVLARNLAFFLPAGLGVQDAGYLAFFSAFGVATPAATAFVLLKRAKELVWIVVGYLLLAAIDRRGTTAVTLVAPHPTPGP